MLIEIYGAGFRNKGAQLMLWTLAQRLRARIPGVRLCVELRPDRPYEARAAYGLHTLLPFPARSNAPLRRLAHQAFDLVFRRRLARPFRRYGLVSRHECDALLDISGYAFGDLWPLHKTLTFAERARFYHRRGRPVILLPQMFGPFEAPGYGAAFESLMRSATLAFAREQVSYDQVARLGIPPQKLALAPDITIFSELPPAPAGAGGEPPYVCLVPNIRMLDQGRQAWGDRYIPLLTRLARRCMEQGLRVFVVIHEGGGRDAELARELVRAVAHADCRLYEEPDPLRLKSFVSRAEFLAGSRFHSIVGAFSTGVPALIMGWAHKYEMLARDFDVPELVLASDDPPATVDRRLEALLDPALRGVMVSKLVAAKQGLRAAGEHMWEQIWVALGLPPAGTPPAPGAQV